MRHRLYVHVTWTTRGREARIDAGAARILARLLPAIARQERAVVLALGMVRSHVHVLLRLHPTTGLPCLMQRLKGGSSVVVNRERGTTAVGALRWAKGYNVDSVSPRAVETVVQYVRNQAQRHPADAIPNWTPPATITESTRRHPAI